LRSARRCILAERAPLSSNRHLLATPQHHRTVPAQSTERPPAMTQAPPVRGKSQRVKRENAKYKQEPEAELQPPTAPPPAAARRASADAVGGVRRGASSSTAHRRGELEICVEKAQLLDTLVEQNGCSNGAELGILIARLRRRDQEHRLRHPDDGDRMQEDEDDEDAAPASVYATMQNCRGLSKQKEDDRFLQCMGVKQKVRRVLRRPFAPPPVSCARGE
jgi:hypothetical protein